MNSADRYAWVGSSGRRCIRPKIESELKLPEFPVSNRGLRPNLVGTPEQVRERIEEFEAAGLDRLLLQMSQTEEMDRFAAQVIGTMKKVLQPKVLTAVGISNEGHERGA